MVYHAEDRLLDAEVAVKVVRANLAIHRRFRANFAREIAISARIEARGLRSMVLSKLINQGAVFNGNGTVAHDPGPNVGVFGFGQ